MFIGAEELKNQKFNLKNIVTGQVYELSTEEIISKFRNT